MQLMQMASGFFVSQSISVAARLGIADRLAEGTQTAEDLAQATGTHAPSLYRLLRALQGVGVFAEAAPGRWSNTPTSAALRSGVPGSMRAVAIMLGDPEHYRAWGSLDHSIRTGAPAFDHVFGSQVFEYFGQHPEAAAVFDEAMTSFSELSPVADAYDFSEIGTLMDVAGGHGGLLASILRPNPDLRGVLFDLPPVIERARERGILAAEGLAERTELVAGSFFEEIPARADACLLQHIIHDWDNEHCVKILENCRRALNPGGKILVVEAVVLPGTELPAANFADLNMLVMTTGGRERTEAEFRELFELAGLRLTQIIPTQSPMTNVIEAVPA